MIPDDARPVRGPVSATERPVALVPSRPWMKRGLIRACPSRCARQRSGECHAAPTPIALHPGRPRRADPRARPPRRRAPPPGRAVPGAHHRRARGRAVDRPHDIGPTTRRGAHRFGCHLGAARPAGHLPGVAPPRRRVEPVRPGAAATRSPGRAADRAHPAHRHRPPGLRRLRDRGGPRDGGRGLRGPRSGRRRAVVQPRTGSREPGHAAAAPERVAARLGIPVGQPDRAPGDRPDRRRRLRVSAGTRT